MSLSSPFTQWVTSSPELNQFFKSSDPPSASLSTVLSWHELGAKAEAVATEELAFIDVIISHPGHSLQSRKGYLQSLLITKSILSPIHRLPPEILLIIFKEEQVTVGASADRYYEVTDASRGPWMLSHICRQWRALVISNPTLWSRSVIILNCSATSKATTPPLEVALARSGQSNLSFFLSQSFRQLGDQAGLFREVLNLLVPHSSRWADVVFEKKEWDTIDISMLNMVHGKVPRLRRVTFKYVGYFLQPPSLLETIQAFSLAPLLKRVALLGYVLFQDIDIALPWNQVMQFQYSMNNCFSTLFSHTEACLDILKQMPRLSALNIVNQGQSRSCLTPLEHPLKTYIHTFLISLCTTDVGLINALALPSLESLTVSLNQRRWTGISLNAAKVLHHLSIRSGCSLKFLHLSGIEMCRDHIVDGLLALNQFLAVFKYRNGCSRGDDIPYLFDRLNDASLLPNLSEISLEYRQALTNQTRFGMLLDKILLFAENRIGSIRHVDNKVLVKEWKTLPIFYKFCQDAKGHIDDLAVRGMMVTIDVVADIDGLNDMRERQALRSY
ncbi:hypothetical protein IW262DRAFT_1469100 [Armillaria fumosa]|nr:hypothetical protein IW262DRAFT_1469100 [Armillaria fumosa]